MSASRRLFVLVLGLALFFTCCAQAMAASKPGGAKPTYTVSGTVRSGYDSASLASAQVALKKVDRRGVETTAATAVADAFGRYSMTVGSTGSYIVEAAAGAHFSTRLPLTIKNAQAYTVDFVLDPWLGTIQGTVWLVDPHPGGADDVTTVDFYRRNGDGTWPSAPTTSVQAIMNGYNGAYTSPPLPMGEYKVGFGNSMYGYLYYPYTSSSQYARVVVLSAVGQSVEGISASLRIRTCSTCHATATGTMVSSLNGYGAAGTVSASRVEADGSLTFVGRATTYPFGGGYSIALPTPGRYAIDFEATSYLPIRSYVDVTTVQAYRVDATMMPAPGTIGGTVFLSIYGQHWMSIPERDADISFYPSVDGAPGPVPAATVHIGGWAGPDIPYISPPLPDGQYFVKFESPSFVPAYYSDDPYNPYPPTPVLVGASLPPATAIDGYLDTYDCQSCHADVVHTEPVPEECFFCHMY